MGWCRRVGDHLARWWRTALTSPLFQRLCPSARPRDGGSALRWQGGPWAAASCLRPWATGSTRLRGSDHCALPTPPQDRVCWPPQILDLRNLGCGLIKPALVRMGRSPALNPSLPCGLPPDA